VEINSLKEILLNYFSSLSDREKRVVLIGVPLLVLILYTFTVIVPLETLKGSYERKKEIVSEKFVKLEPEIKEFICLKREIEPVKEKLKRGKNLDVSSYIQSVGRMVGLNIRNVKVMPGEVKNGYERDIVTVTFKEAEINKVARLISVLERGSYYFRADGITVTDYDENGLVSGKVTLFFYRRSGEG